MPNANQHVKKYLDDLNKFQGDEDLSPFHALKYLITKSYEKFSGRTYKALIKDAENATNFADLSKKIDDATKEGPGPKEEGDFTGLMHAFFTLYPDMVIGFKLTGNNACLIPKEGWEKTFAHEDGVKSQEDKKAMKLLAKELNADEKSNLAAWRSNKKSEAAVLGKYTTGNANTAAAPSAPTATAAAPSASAAAQTKPKGP